MSMLPVGFGASGDYTIEESLRFNASQSSYLSWTPASAGSLTTWTFSCWFKRGSLSNSNNQTLFWASGGSAEDGIRIVGTSGAPETDKINFYIYNGGYIAGQFATSQVFRDPSAWYHLVWVWDTTNATSTDRIRLYINGERVTSFSSSTYPALNAQSGAINRTYQHEIGRQSNATTRVFDGYLTEVNFIDGQALDASSFGEFDIDTGVWKPKKYTGTYGTNGFYLNFSDASTTTTLGYDYSGQSNNWLLNNFSLTGTDYCSMTDTPTPYVDGGNYAVLNPLARMLGTVGTSNISTISNSNLTVVPSANNNACQATFGLSSGKWYWEVNVATGTTSNNVIIGISYNGSYSLFDYGVGYEAGGNKSVNGSSSSYGSSTTTGDVIGIALDVDASTITFYKNNTSQGSISYTATSLPVFPAYWAGGGVSANHAFNFGQRPFAYTPPTGFKALHTGNLPDSSIVDGSKYFDVVTRTGTGAEATVSGLQFQPDLLWTKTRSNAVNHSLTSTGLTYNYSFLQTNTTEPENTSAPQYYMIPTSDGYTVGTGDNINQVSRTFVDWVWKANGTGVSNTDGSITSTVSANPTAGFSIVSYTGTGSAATVGHGLGVAPKFIMFFNRSVAQNKATYHGAISPANFVQLDTTGAQLSATTYAMFGTTPTAPTSSVFYVGNQISTNGSANNLVAYCFAEVEGYSKFGSYTGNGSADGPFVYLGFRPAFFMTKCTSTSSDWRIVDGTRDIDNPVVYELNANSSAAETTYSNGIDFNSNGVKIRETVESNTSGATYIYMAFAENPFKNSLAR